MSTVITSIDPHSPAARSGVRVGEKLLSQRFFTNVFSLLMI